MVMGAFLSFVYGSAAYLFFAGTFLYTIGFIGNLFVPKSIDSGTAESIAQAVIVDLVLLGCFAAQHSVMARRSFKQWWMRIVPPALERSTYVLAASLLLALLCWQWQPIPEPIIWNVESAAGTRAIWVVFCLGWVILLSSSFLINHFELFGLSQAAAPLADSDPPAPEFRTPLFYRYVRHPLYLGFLLGFWATPVMTAGHLLFALGATGYILIGIWFEERDLIAQFGEQYRRYRRQVGMLIPSRRA
jgi:protein-S-isoprenylcysteine O-methyltransferase Ste14